MRKIPSKLKARLILQDSGLTLNNQVWLKAKNCFDELYNIINNGDVKNYANVAISSALIKENKFGGSPLIKPCDPKEYFDKKILENRLNELKIDCEKYNGEKDWNENDYLRLFSSPLGINHLFVGISVHFDISKFMKGRWGKIRNGFPLMPVIIEAQQGTWPRYFNTEKSEETVKTFSSFFFDNAHSHWKDEIFGNMKGNFLTVEALSQSLEYVCSIESQIKILNLANRMKYNWIGFDAQYIAKNDLGHQIGFMIYDFVGF